MEQRITVLTIGANNFEAMKAFYEDILGWSSVAQNSDIVFYQMNGFLLSLAKKDQLSSFIDTSLGERGPITIGYNVETEDEVLSIFENLRNKGVKILKEPTAPPFGGLFFYFEDIEGNVLEVACNHFVLMNKDKLATGHKDISGL